MKTKSGHLAIFADKFFPDACRKNSVLSCLIQLHGQFRIQHPKTVVTSAIRTSADCNHFNQNYLLFRKKTPGPASPSSI